MLVDWFLTQLHWHRPGFWLLLSFTSSLLFFIVSWRLPEPQRRWFRLGRWILIPYAGLIAGGLSPRLMGVADLDWVAGLSLGVALIFAIWVLLLLIRATIHTEEAPGEDQTLRLLSFPEQIGWAGAQEFHWAFLRAASWELLLAYPEAIETPAYWSMWIASLLALPGVFVQYNHTSQRLVTGVVLITTTILFFYTRNFWLCWLLHATSQLLLAQPWSSENLPDKGSAR
jgi:predicted permease